MDHGVVHCSMPIVKVLGFVMFMSVPSLPSDTVYYAFGFFVQGLLSVSCFTLWSFCVFVPAVRTTHNTPILR